MSKGSKKNRVDFQNFQLSRTSGYASSVSGSIVSKPTNAPMSGVAVPMDASSTSHDDKLIEFLNDPAAAPAETKSAAALSRRSSSSSIRSLPVSALQAQQAAPPSKAVINVENLQQKGFFEPLKKIF